MCVCVCTCVCVCLCVRVRSGLHKCSFSRSAEWAPPTCVLCHGDDNDVISPAAVVSKLPPLHVSMSCRWTGPLTMNCTTYIRLYILYCIRLDHSCTVHGCTLYILYCIRLDHSYCTWLYTVHTVLYQAGPLLYCTWLYTVHTTLYILYCIRLDHSCTVHGCTLYILYCIRLDHSPSCSLYIVGRSVLMSNVLHGICGGRSRALLSSCTSVRTAIRRFTETSAITLL